MKVVAAFDSFKGSLTSRQAGEAAATGVRAAVPGAEVVVVGVADGGEGLVDALLVPGRDAEVVVDAVDPFGRPVRAGFAVLEDGTAVVEAARTIGLDLVGPIDPSVPLRASSYGLGLQLAAALASGAPRVLVGLGGSATTDGGTGLLAALGARLEVGHTAGAGNLLPSVVAAVGLPDLRRVEVLTDVLSPLLGPTGAARMFGPQKGADAVQVELLETSMTRWVEILAAAAGRPVAAVKQTPGAGAAGGLGAALLACGARLVPGFARVAALVGLPEALVGADLVLTGEGSFDAQSALGKGPVGVADLARAAGVPVVVLAGRVAHPLGPLGDRVDAAFGIHPSALPLLDALDPVRAAANLTATAGEVARLVLRLAGQTLS